MIKKLLLVPLVAVFLFVGAARVQAVELPDPGILPDNPLYLLKNWSEEIGTFFTFGSEAKAERLLYLAEKRLAEAEAQVAKGKPEMAEKIIDRYQERLEQAMEKAEEAKVEGLDTDEVLARVSEATLKHQAVLAEVYEKVPEQAKPTIERAMQAGIKGHEEALKNVSEARQDEMMDRFEREREEVGEKLEQLRDRGVPVPRIPDKGEMWEIIKRDLPDEVNEIKADEDEHPRGSKYEEEIKKEIKKVEEKIEVKEIEETAGKKMKNKRIGLDKPDRVERQDEGDKPEAGEH